MSRFNSSGAGKGPDSRVSDHNSYWSSPLWNNMKNKKYNSYSEFSEDFTPIVDAYKPERWLFLDDIRDVRNAWIYDENKTLQQASGIKNESWDVVRSYDEFVEYVEKYGIPQVVSFDNDLTDCLSTDIPEDLLYKSFQMIDWEESPIKTGAHCAAWLCERCKAHQHPLPNYYVHSANSLASPIIKGLFEAAKPLIKH